MKNHQIMTVIDRDGNPHKVEFYWTKSRGRYTYGYNRVTAYADGVKIGAAMGGGYDLKGRALQTWLTTHVKPTDKANYGSLDNTPGIYGLHIWDKEKQAQENEQNEHTIVAIDGACGLESCIRALGMRYEWVRY